MLMESIPDQELFIHVQAVAALVKFCGSEDLKELREDKQTATEVLKNLIVNEPSACVSPPHSCPS
jgi:hypothetical protein